MINRDLSSEFLRLSGLFPVVTLVGPRQSGKTTLCKMLFPNFLYFNLEDVRNREMMAFDAYDFFLRQNQNIILDEVHNMPELFSVIQVFVDEHPDRHFCENSPTLACGFERVLYCSHAAALLSEYWETHCETSQDLFS